MVPSSFVAFYCLTDPYTDREDEDSTSLPEKLNKQNLDTSDVPSKDGHDGQTSPPKSTTKRPLSGQELKARDDELIRLITERKKVLVERGIKLTVVLLTTRGLLESQQLEARLSYIRRSSALDTKASLFVLTPVSKEELSDFVTSLQSALYDHALDYYREHARRVRRKRARYPPPPSVVQPVFEAVAATKPASKPSDFIPLSRDGWHVRAEYKLATFWEFSADYELAMAHYQEAYDLLAGARGILGSTALLPPRTKRWAEAKVLSDTLSLRIIKLRLYGDDCAGAVAQFRKHIARFAELSAGWGIGDATFEYWSWLGKQYRLMAGLLEQATRPIPGSPLPPVTIPIHAPPLPGFLLHPEIADKPQKYPSLRASPGALLSPNGAAMASGTAPASLLQVPASYYYMAALCAIERKTRFVKMKALEQSDQLSEGAAAALVHEKSVDHCAQVVEFSERAIELYKRANCKRLALFVAARVASVYAEDGQQAQTLRFVQQTRHQYKEEDWSEPLFHLLSLGLKAAQHCSDRIAQISILYQLLAAESAVRQESAPAQAADISVTTTDDVANSMAEAWARLTDVPPSGPSVAPSQGRQTDKTRPEHNYAGDQGPLRAAVVFSQPAVEYGKKIAFQIKIAHPGCRSSIKFRFAKMEIFDQGNHLVSTIEVDPACQDSSSSIIHIEEQKTSSAASLEWTGGQVKVIQGSIHALTKGWVAVSHIVLRSAISSDLDFSLELKPSTAVKATGTAPLWYCQGRRGVRQVALMYCEEPSLSQVVRPKHHVEVQLDHHEWGYLDEVIHIRIDITNKEQRSLACSVGAILNPAYAAAQDELGKLGSQPTLSGLLEQNELGTLGPNESLSTTFTLTPRHRPASRSLTFLVRTIDSTEKASGNDHELSGEIARDVSLPIHRALRAEYSASWEAPRPDGSAAAVAGFEHKDVNLLVSGEDDAFHIAGTSNGAQSAGHSTVVANLQAAFGVLTKVDILIKDVHLELDDDVVSGARILNDEGERAVAFKGARSASLDGSWCEGDRWGSSWQAEVNVKTYEAEEGYRGPTGHMMVSWLRASDTEDTSDRKVNVTRLPLPILAPPHLNARVLVASPPVTQALQAFTLVFVIVNPSAQPVDVSLVIDDDSAWVLSHRTLSIPGIPPRGSRSIPTRIVPRAGGTWSLPRVRAFQQRNAEAIEASGGLLFVNETQYGLPLQVRYRASAGASLGTAAQRALAAGGSRPVEQEGPSLSILVVAPEAGEGDHRAGVVS